MKITGVTPWLVKSGGSYWGEFLFVEVTTDEGVSGWGEITTTTFVANRALCVSLRHASGFCNCVDEFSLGHLVSFESRTSSWLWVGVECTANHASRAWRGQHQTLRTTTMQLSI